MNGTPRPPTPVARFSASITDGNLKGALDALARLPVTVMREVLLNAGFRVTFEKTRPKVLAAVQAQLMQAVAARTLPRNPLNDKLTQPTIEAALGQRPTAPSGRQLAFAL